MGASVFIARCTRGSCSSTSSWLTIPDETLRARPYGAPTSTTFVAHVHVVLGNDLGRGQRFAVDRQQGKVFVRHLAFGDDPRLEPAQLRPLHHHLEGALPERPSRWTTCSLVSTYEVSPSFATTHPAGRALNLAADQDLDAHAVIRCVGPIAYHHYSPLMARE